MKLINNIKILFWYLDTFGFKKIIYSAGIPRSGSTLLYNIIRIILEKEFKKDLSYFWIDDIHKESINRINLIKTHHLNKIDILRSYQTFYTFRDIRDVLVSRLKMFDKAPTIEIVRYHIRLHQIVENMGCHTFRYETMIKDLQATIHNVANILEIEINPSKVKAKLPHPQKSKAPQKGHDDKTLLHKNHTTGTKPFEWKEVLPQKLQDQIHKEFDWWFEENDYKI